MQKVLIANRGEIAVRIIRACQELNIHTVAVYSVTDRDALHVQLADESICIGPANPMQSYLNQASILEAARITGADAIHPGYGFLSENAEFAKLCEDNEIEFIGPTSAVIEMLGDKAEARSVMIKAGVPVTPGSGTEFTDLATGLEQAGQIGYPVMLKAAAGGGGKGMRLIKSAKNFQHEFQLAQGEAEKAFGNNEMYLEKFIVRPRHIEVQVLGDNHGNVIAVGERDCSLQQYHQKVIEEAPSSIDPATRDEILQTAIRAAAAVNYAGAGTLEFLYEGPGQYYFMEMNTRIQVEHPITEVTSGIDLVQAQIKIAAGEALSLSQADVKQFGHAIECRITARTPGEITGLHLPCGPGIRIETAIYQGYQVPANYDAMIAKVIVFANTREQAIMKAKVAIAETVIIGPETNLEFLYQILNNRDFNNDQIDIEFLDRLTSGDGLNG